MYTELLKEWTKERVLDFDKPINNVEQQIPLLKEFVTWLESRRLTRDAPEMTVGDSGSVSEHSADDDSGGEIPIQIRDADSGHTIYVSSVPRRIAAATLFIPCEGVLKIMNIARKCECQDFAEERRIKVCSECGGIQEPRRLPYKPDSLAPSPTPSFR